MSPRLVELDSLIAVALDSAAALLVAITADGQFIHTRNTIKRQ